MANHLLFGVVCVFLVSCSLARGPQSTVRSTEFPIYDLEKTSCNDDETPMTYSLIASSTKAVTKTETGLQGRFEMDAAQPNYLSGYRFEICMDGNDHLRLKRILHPTGTIGLGRLAYTAYIPDSGDYSAALVEAISSQNYEAFSIPISNQENPKYSYMLKGAKRADGYQFLLFYTYDKTRGTIAKANTETVTYGELVQFDALLNEPKNNDRAFTAPNLAIELRYEISGAPGMYVHYRFHSLKLRDTNPALAQPIEATYSENEVGNYVTAILSHHSLNDVIEIKLPGATYRIGPGTSDVGLAVTYASPTIPALFLAIPCRYAVDCGTVLGPI